VTNGRSNQEDTSTTGIPAERTSVLSNGKHRSPMEHLRRISIATLLLVLVVVGVILFLGSQQTHRGFLTLQQAGNSEAAPVDSRL